MPTGGARKAVADRIQIGRGAGAPRSGPGQAPVRPGSRRPATGQLTRNSSSQIATQWHSAASDTQAWKYSWYPKVLGQVFGRRVA